MITDEVAAAGRSANLHQSETPYFDALRDYVEKEVVTFHVPGHQQGRGAALEFASFVAQHGLAADITQVLGMDDIHRPESVCKKAQELAAEAYGAEHTYFLINGSSSGNQIMFVAALRPGDTVLIPRNAHRSVISSLILAGARAVFYQAPYDLEMGVVHTPSASDVRRACELHPEAKALFFTSPTYYGACADVRELVRIGHDFAKTVLVDEAWGAHLAFHPELPISAVQAGADLVVQSTHKLSTAMSQGAMLHLNGTRIDRGRLEASLRMFLSTSPLFLLVASLDVARQQMVTQGRELLQTSLELSAYARTAINELPGLRCYTLQQPWDPTRLVISATQMGLSGYDVEKQLRYRHNLQIEMSELYNIVVVITPGHEKSHVDLLLKGLADLQPGIGTFPRHAPQTALPQAAMTLREAFDAPHETVPLGQSVGRVCAEMVTPYPPGIPLLCPGEIISQELVELLGLELAAGVNIQGAFDLHLNTIRVVAEELK